MRWSRGWRVAPDWAGRFMPATMFARVFAWSAVVGVVEGDAPVAADHALVALLAGGAELAAQVHAADHVRERLRVVARDAPPHERGGELSLVALGFLVRGHERVGR